ncbi:MAG: MMPL family transporter [Pseudomonadota bacterium]
MNISEIDKDQFRVIADQESFNLQSGNFFEKLVFNHRAWILAVLAVLTLVLGYFGAQVEMRASFLKAIPGSHPFIANFLKYESQVKGLGNSLRIAIEVNDTTANIFDRAYLKTLRDINDEVYLLTGVDQTFMRSMWMPSVRWTGVTDDGYEGGPVIPDNYDGSAAAISLVRDNALRSGEVGQLIAPDLRSSIIYLPLEETAARRLDYRALSERLEAIRAKYENQGVKIHITGFAKVMGDMIAGLHAILAFFAGAVLLALMALYYFTRCARSTALVVGTTLLALVWLTGLMSVFGFEFNPYSILIPFLIFAIGVSHGTQKMNGVMQDIGRGNHRLVAARYTFRRLFMAGVTALLADMVGFAVLAMIDIPGIRELALIASIGVTVLIVTNLVLIPVMLSYTGVSMQAAQRSLRYETSAQSTGRGLWRVLGGFTGQRMALLALACALGLGAAGYAASRHLKVGDLHGGAPELRSDSRYNLDNAFIVHHYQAGNDVFVTFAVTAPGQCADYQNLALVDALDWTLRQLPEVVATRSFAAEVRGTSAGLNEGSLKWYDLPRNQFLINAAAARAPRELFNATCDLLSTYAYLKDHKADTLIRVGQAVEKFARENPSGGLAFKLAAGNAGIEAATNQVVEKANWQMNLGVYLGVILLCLLAFRSWRGMLCAVLPLVLTSLLVEALMVFLGMGVKVATLPVIALGVGIGVDYALYILSVTLAQIKAGDDLSTAYDKALLFTGRVVIFTGFTLAIGVVLWVFSPIKFQADMGVLLTFMFLGNMIGSLVLIPALARLLGLGRQRARF